MMALLFGGYIVEFIFGRYSVLFYSTVAFVISAIAAFEYVAALPVAVGAGDVNGIRMARIHSEKTQRSWKLSTIGAVSVYF